MNVPDDWGDFRFRCTDCGRRYHESGEEVCACVWCSECSALIKSTPDPDGTLCEDCYSALCNSEETCNA